MSIYEAIQLFAASLVVLLSMVVGNRRGAGWVLAITINMAISTAAWVGDMPYAAAIVATLDFALCVLIYQLGRNKWENWLFLLYQGSMLVSVLRLAMDIWAPGYVSHDLYSSLLEGVNYCAFLLIATISGIQIGSSNDYRGRLAFSPWRRLAMFVLPVFRDAETDRT